MPLRRVLTAFLMAGLLLLVPACGGDSDTTGSAGTASPTASVQKQKLAKTRFVANAGLAAGATYQWIVKPYRAGKFKKGADGRRTAMVKAALAGAFAYNRLKAASDNAKADPTLSKLVAPLTSGIDALKDLPSKLRKGEGTDDVVSTFQDTITNVKSAGRQGGAKVTDQIPSLGQLAGG
ncbi:hypothetical protein ACFYXS_00410 [Streptomyces sp. NPDC002574]|uniref:hypothetical protein n=1 Tax=Streptomyces sp. NPDC002574 TaxID=3364652 RepID=UPI0036B3DD2B